MKLSIMAIPLSRGLYALVDGEDYDWLNRRRWYASCNGYAVRGVYLKSGKTSHIFMHREIIGLSNDDGKQIDHKNNRKLDNRKQNLRICNQSQNSQNQLKKTKTSSIFKGVCWDKKNKKWQAQIGVDKKDIYLGQFEKEIEAASAYNKAAVKQFGEFARTNF